MKILVVSCVLIVVFYLALNLSRIIIQRTYAHSLKQLTTLSYLSDDQMKFFDFQILYQLRDITIDINKRKCKNIIRQMFCIEFVLVKKTLLAWFNEKFKSQYLKIHTYTKMKYERNNLIDWRTDKYCICKMPLRVEPTNYEMADDEMTYRDFIICFEHKFIKKHFHI